MSDTQESVGEAFAMGVLVGVVLMTVITLASLSSNTPTITSTVRITPETQLTTDGKVVDTLYIYTEK